LDPPKIFFPGIEISSKGSDLVAGRARGKRGERNSRSKMIHFVILISRQGKVRLTKWYSPYQQKERSTVIRELSGLILTRGPKLCNFVEWKGYKVVYRRYASLYFCMCIDPDDNELEVLEIIHHFVEILDRYFGSVCELDLIFNFHKAYYILDEILIAGELQESSKKAVARVIAAQVAVFQIWLFLCYLCVLASKQITLTNIHLHFIESDINQPTFHMVVQVSKEKQIKQT
ncbi:hypothetical protein GW17_00048183, partial [Ensete ventricosum]